MKDKITTYKIRVTFDTPILGNQGSKTIATDYISKKSGIDFTEEELETLPEMLERQTLVFNKNGESVVVFGYQFKGALKNAAAALNGQAGNGVKALHSKIEKHVFVSPTGYIPLYLPAKNGDAPKQATNADITYVERPLRAKTAQGDRVAVLRSECLPAGCYFECGLIVYPGDIDEPVLTDLLNYLYDIGMGGWRGADYGHIIYKLVKEDISE